MVFHAFLSVKPFLSTYTHICLSTYKLCTQTTLAICFVHSENTCTLHRSYKTTGYKSKQEEEFNHFLHAPQQVILGSPCCCASSLALWEEHSPVGSWTSHMGDRFVHNYNPRAGPLARMSLHSPHSGITEARVHEL